MKILNVVTHLDPVTGGGFTERTRQMSRYLAKCGEEVTILTTDYGLTDEGRIMAGVEVVALPSLVKRFYLPFLPLNRIKKIVAEADVIHLIGHWSFLNAVVYLLVKRLNKPYVVCPAGALPIFGRSKVLKFIYNSLIGRKIIKNADAHILVTAAELPQLEDYGVKTDKVRVIPNGIDFEQSNDIDVTEFRDKAGLGPDPFILFVGRLNHIKGPDLLLRAFYEALTELPPYHLVFAGPDGGMRQELEETVARYGLGARVHFLGYIGNPTKSQAYYASHLVVIPSRQEAMSIVVLEAGIIGTPVLITDQCGYNEVAAINGGEVVPASVAGLKAGLLRLLKDPQKLATQGANIKKFTREHFLWDAIVLQYLELYRKILGTDKAA
jgi:glycosyltransferase involved in cell wall biosynthesis